jgi:hypothetical protein
VEDGSDLLESITFILRGDVGEAEVVDIAAFESAAEDNLLPGDLLDRTVIFRIVSEVFKILLVAIGFKATLHGTVISDKSFETDFRKGNFSASFIPDFALTVMHLMVEFSIELPHLMSIRDFRFP